SADLVPFGFLNGDPLAFLGTYAAALTALLTQGELVRDGLIKDMTIDRALKGFQHLSYLMSRCFCCCSRTGQILPPPHCSIISTSHPTLRPRLSIRPMTRFSCPPAWGI